MKISLITLVFTSLFFSPALNKDGDEILGTWLTDDKRAKIQIFKEGQRYHGKIVWLKEPKDGSGNIHKDTKNPDKALRDRPILGITLVSDFVFERGRWTDGEIYDPDNGKTYDCNMKLKRNKLEVRGYVGISMFGRTVVWTRTDSVN